MQVIVSHVFREGNFVNDALANLVLSLFDFSWWTNVVDDALWKLNYS
jgi:hypothetical protein